MFLEIVQDWSLASENGRIVNNHGFNPKFLHGVITCDFVILGEFLNIWEILDIGLIHEVRISCWASRILSQRSLKFSSSVGGKSKSAHEEKMSVSKSCCAEVRRIVNWSVNFMLLFYTILEWNLEKMDSLKIVHGRLDFLQKKRPPKGSGFYANSWICFLTKLKPFEMSLPNSWISNWWIAQRVWMSLR